MHTPLFSPLGADNKLYYPSSSPFTINAFHGYFQLKGIVAGDSKDEAQSVHIVMNMADYTTDGRRINGQPTQKGIYIHNGKKYVVSSSLE